MAWDPKRYHQGGELMIDHRASPGLPPDIARQCGFDPALAGEGRLFEVATLTCAHCKVVQAKNKYRIRSRERCEKCNHYVCDHCYRKMQKPDYIHYPYDKFRDETMEGRVKEMTLGSQMELLRKTIK